MPLPSDLPFVHDAKPRNPNSEFLPNPCSGRTHLFQGGLEEVLLFGGVFHGSERILMTCPLMDVTSGLSQAGDAKNCVVL